MPALRVQIPQVRANAGANAGANDSESHPKPDARANARAHGKPYARANTGAHATMRHDMAVLRGRGSSILLQPAKCKRTV